MTVTETVTKSGITPNPEYKGVETADDFILAIQTDAAKQTKPSDWIVCADHIKEHAGSLNAATSVSYTHLSDRGDEKEWPSWVM